MSLLDGFVWVVGQDGVIRLLAATRNCVNEDPL